MTAKRIWTLTDTHFGYGNNSLRWLNTQKKFFYELFIPMLKKHYREGDIVVHSGDFFQIRESMNLLVMHEALNVVNTISSICPMYIIVGNHDLYKKAQNDVNSCAVFQQLPNVTVVESTHYIEGVNGKKIFLMAWQNTKEQERETLDSNMADILFCHTEIKGLELAENRPVEHGVEPKYLENYQRVYSGHIHYRQEVGKVTMMGCPYQLRRDDMGNQKGFYVIDVANLKHKFIPNKITPEFKKISLSALLNMDLEEAKKEINYHYVDVLLGGEMATQISYYAVRELFKEVMRLEFKIISDNQSTATLEELTSSEAIKKIDIINKIRDYVDGMKVSDKLKSRMISTLEKTYNEAVENTKIADVA